MVSSDRTSLAVDFTSQVFKGNPFPILKRMREAGPVVRVRFSMFGNVWMATTHKAVSELLHDPLFEMDVAEG
jgi:hypothetical protein